MDNYQFWDEMWNDPLKTENEKNEQKKECWLKHLNKSSKKDNGK